MSENDNVSPDYITMLIHTTPTDMLSDSLARTCLQAAVRRWLQWTRDHPSPEGSVHNSEMEGSLWTDPEGSFHNSEMEGSARSSQWSDDDDTYTCHGDSCEFVGTFAGIFLHENQCEHWAATVAAALEDAEIEDPEIETEMSQAETETE